MTNNRFVLWSLTGLLAMILAIMSLVLVAYALNRVGGAIHDVQAEANTSCRRANALRHDVRKLIHDQLKITPRTPPQEAASIQAFLDDTDLDLAPVVCPKP